MKPKDKLQVSNPLFYADNGELMGRVTKVLKRIVHVKTPSGNIIPIQKSMAANLLR